MKKLLLLAFIITNGTLFLTINCQNTIVLRPDSETGKDAQVLSYNPENNYGDWESLVAYTWTYNSELAVKRIFIEFNLDTIPENAEIISALLSLYFNPLDNTEPTFDTHNGFNDMYIQRVMAHWDEDSINWNNQPAFTNLNTVEVSRSDSPTQDYIDIDISDLVTDIINSYEGNNGFMIKMQNETDPYRNVLFASSDNIDETLHPQLQIYYNIDTSSIINQDDLIKFTVFPNPNNGAFTLDLVDVGLTDYNLVIFDIIGNEIMKCSLSSGKHQIEVFNKGLIIIYLTDNYGNTSCKKVLLQ